MYINRKEQIGKQDGNNRTHDRRKDTSPTRKGKKLVEGDRDKDMKHQRNPCRKDVEAHSKCDGESAIP